MEMLTLGTFNQLRVIKYYNVNMVVDFLLEIN